MTAFLLTASYISVAQSSINGTLKGRVLHKRSNMAVPGLLITLPDAQLSATTSSDGSFTISGVPSGKYMIVASGTGFNNDTSEVNITASGTEIATIFVIPSDEVSQDNEIPTISLDENTAQSEENNSTTSESSSSFYVANSDPFLYTAATIFGPYRFRPRGYDNTDVHVNGIQLRNLETGFASFGQIGGLNPALRDRTITYGLRPADFSFGSVKGSTYIDATAGNQRKGTQLSYTAGNGALRNSIKLMHSSGIDQKGWGYSFCVSRSWSQQGYVPGTYFDGVSLYAGVTKLTKKGEFDVTAFAVRNERGRSTAEISEVFALTDNNFFNGAWGYQNGKVRTAKADIGFQPLIIANYIHRPSDKTLWNTAIGYQFGTYTRTDWEFYNGTNPNPTFYKKLPYYFLEGNEDQSFDAYNALTRLYSNNPDRLQVQWDNLYNSNYANTETINDVNGVAGNNVTGKRSIYAIRNEVDDMRKIAFNSTISHVPNDNLTINGGVEIIHQQNEYYKEIGDLLGGDFFLNYNQFAQLTNLSNLNYRQNDLNTPNRLVKVGEKYGYDYILRTTNTTTWAQGVYKSDKIDFFLAGEGGFNTFNREGLMRNGLFPGNSFGKSKNHNFFTGRVKGGFLAKLNAHHAVFANAGYFSGMPRIDNMYISPRTRDFLVDGVGNNITTTGEVGYELHLPGLFARITGYATNIANNTIIKRFWNDDPDLQSFVNYVMQGVDTRSTGIEFAASYKISKSFFVTGVAAVGQSFYTNRPMVSIYNDNSPEMIPVQRRVYIQNYYLGVGPQSIYSLGLKYQAAHALYINANVNYMDRNYVEINPDRRTQLSTEMIDSNSTKWNNILMQEKLPSAYTVDISASRTIDIGKFVPRFRNGCRVTILVGINNLLNNQNIRNVGFEQLRFDFRNYNAAKFPNKYSYAYGRTFIATATFKF
jgi:hypothetical protein